jgi:hypothetical protein
VRERVAVVAGVAEQVLEQARGLSRLEDLLRPPQARGALGELLLEQLLAQGLPQNAYRTQHLFRSGARVDAVLLLGDAMVAVDSKFPLEAFARMSTAAEGDAARALHRRAFTRDARRHVDAIADKYICPDEGTYDFALCYLPSEAVFYEFLREDPPGTPAGATRSSGGSSRPRRPPCTPTWSRSGSGSRGCGSRRTPAGCWTPWPRSAATWTGSAPTSSWSAAPGPGQGPLAGRRPPPRPLRRPPGRGLRPGHRPGPGPARAEPEPDPDAPTGELTGTG